MRALVLVVLTLVLCMMMTPAAVSVMRSSSEPVGLQAEESVLKIGILQEINSLNPLMGWNDADYLLYSLVYDCLTSVGNDLEVVGNLANEWMAVPESDPEMVISGDPYGSVWEYNLTVNATWHDGEPFTADDVAWNMNLHAENYNMMWSHQPYSFFLDYAEIIDSDTVRVHFCDRTTSEPIPVAFGDSMFIPMLPSHLLSSMSAADIVFNWNGTFNSTSTPIVGTGPFMATSDIWAEFAEGDHLTLVRNPGYHWAADKGLEVHFDKIVIYMYDDEVMMHLALQQGNIDVAQFPSGRYDSIKEAVEEGTLENVATFDGLKVNQYWTEVLFNMNDAGPNPSRLDPAIREALAMATDKAFITDTFYMGYAEPGSTLVSPLMDEWHCELAPEELYLYNLTEAAQRLEDAGYVYTPESPSVRVASNCSQAVILGLVPEGTPLAYDMMVRAGYPEERDTAQLLAEVWADIGVDLDYRVLDEVTMSTEIYSYEYDTAIWYWCSDPDPNYILFVQSERAWNAWSDNLYFNPAYDENYTASVSEMDRETRGTYVDDCQRIHYEDAAYIILAYNYQTYAWRTDTFSGWGDWDADPGRSLDACWGANPLLFDLVPIIAPNEPPTAVAEADPTSAVVGEEVALNGSGSSDPDGTIVSYEWVITEGLTEVATLSGVTPVYTFSAAGSYKATLNVTDDGGLWDTDFVMVSVTEPPNEPPVADAGDDEEVEVGDTVTFDGSGSTDDVLVTNYTWNFTYDGDEVELYDEAPTFVFDIVGTYVVTLTVSDAEDETDEDTMTVTVSEPAPPENVAPDADAGDDQAVDVGDTVTFDGTGSTDSDGTIVSYNWTFEYDGEDQVLTGAEPTFDFDIVGTYTVTLTVTDDYGETGTDTVTITVEEPEEDDKSFLESYGLPIALIVVVLVVVVLAFLLMKRKKSA